VSRAPASTAPAVPTAARPHGASAADRPDTPGTPKAIADLIAERLAGLEPVHVDLRDDSAAHALHAGAAGGAVAGKVVGGKTGPVVGGIAGAVGGAVLANQTADRDVIVAPGFKVIFTLGADFTVTR